MSGQVIAVSFVLPALVAFVLSTILTKQLIPVLHKLKFGQYEREDGMASHQKKAGTPTMGGIAWLLALILTCLVFLKGNPMMLPVLFLTVGFGVIGFLDDYLKIAKKENEGLTVVQKLIGQIAVTGIFGAWMLYGAKIDTSVILPFTGGKVWTMSPVLFWIFLFFVVIGTVNGTNFTDGLDGLSSSVSVVVALFFGVSSLMASAFGVSVISGAMAGALMGFLVYNAHPAKVFMGDTGSLALGGFVAGSALMLGQPIFIVIAGFIYLMEVVSVILQVGYFKLTHGKRLFKMAPIHHHFELLGWSETKVVTVFTCVTVLLCLIAICGL
ncbi:MAG: phospho-N-acetylmuramoyl-pentapeptide-transferase [Lachnospiraceae bacterium]|nr:phospho-N-acetylmuramoyl-pentapeptide-transferase [Lachnospiraceae bacterium]